MTLPSQRAAVDVAFDKWRTCSEATVSVKENFQVGLSPESNYGEFKFDVFF